MIYFLLLGKRHQVGCPTAWHLPEQTYPRRTKEGELLLDSLLRFSVSHSSDCVYYEGLTNVS